jgi:hypothetical protein
VPLSGSAGTYRCGSLPGCWCWYGAVTSNIDVDLPG